MKNLPQNVKDPKQLLAEYQRLLREFDRLKDENRELKEQLGLGNLEYSPNKEAVEVIDRLGDAFTKPVEKFYERQQNSSGTPVPTNYNYNIYMVFGKKLMTYSDALAQQSSIYLDPSTLGELDYFNRRLSQSFYDLYQVGLNETINSTHLDLEQLEQDIHSMN